MKKILWIVGLVLVLAVVSVGLLQHFKPETLERFSHFAGAPDAPEVKVEDFELRFRFRWWDGNSGVHYRARQLTNYAVGGYEFEIFNKRIGELTDNGVDRALHDRDNGAADNGRHHVRGAAFGERTQVFDAQ